MIKLSKRAIARIEKRYWTKFWGSKCLVSPKFVSEAVGDGNKLIYMTPLNTRPQYYVIRVDSAWDCSNFHDGETIADHLDEIFEAIEDQYGYYYDGHSSEYEHDNGTYPGWPVCFNEGCAWGELDLVEYGIAPSGRLKRAG